MPNKLIAKLKENKGAVRQKALIFGGTLLGLIIVGAALTQYNANVDGTPALPESTDDESSDNTPEG